MLVMMYTIYYFHIYLNWISNAYIYKNEYLLWIRITAHRESEIMYTGQFTNAHFTNMFHMNTIIIWVQKEDRFILSIKNYWPLLIRTPDFASYLYATPQYISNYICHHNWFHWLRRYSYGLVHTFRVGSVFSTLSVTLERFFAIVFPLRDVSCIKSWLIPFTTIFTIVFNFPKFFEISCSRDADTNKIVVSGSEMRQNHLYVTFYVVWGKLIVTDLMPYTVIVILNSFIISKIIKSSRFRSRVTSSLRFKDGNR